jgi:hypothetical protein
MNGNQTRGAPLGWTQGGDPIELPDAAALWRVRRLTGNGKGGAPELVYGDDGLPLVVEIMTPVGDFREAVDHKPGKYRLDALDEHRKAIPGVPPAYVTVPGAGVTSRPEANDSASGTEVALRILADVVDRQQAQVSSILEACTKLITAVDAAGVSRREPPPVVVAPQAPAPRNGVADNDQDDDDQDDDDQDDGDQDDDDGDDDEREPPLPQWLHIATHFCSQVPPQNLGVVVDRALDRAPGVVADGVGELMRRGIAGIISGANDDKGGGS